MRKSIKRVLIGLAICINLLAVFSVVSVIVILLFLGGVIPQYADMSLNAGYLGYQPSSGKVWEHACGWNDGFRFTRLHLKPSSYRRQELVKLLTAGNMPEIAYSAPWWWGVNPDGKTTILIGCGKSGKDYEIYDPSRELLFTYDEW